MAELVGGAFLSSFFQVTLDKLASSDFMDYLTRRGKLDDKLVDKLGITLNSINQVLDDAETKQYKSIHVKKWLDELKHIVYEADQLLDEIATDAPLKKMKAESQPSTSKVLGFFSAFTNPFESRIKELLEKLDFLAKQKDRLGLKEGTAASNEGGVNRKPSEGLPTTSLVDESSIYGRDGNKKKIIKFLLSDNDSGNQVPIISIVGLGGMGKTTLAQLVYNDQTVKEQFETKAWVYVSESFDVVGLTKAILTSFQSSADGEDLNLLQHQLQQRLIGKKYLLVLDDVWNGNGEWWECLLLPFNHGHSGSKIIVTTRDKEVASIMKSTELLDLSQLEECECWSLFVRHAFHGKVSSDYPNLESIGKNIVKKCGGLPLAVKTLGNLLQRKFSPREWVNILETDVWRLSEGDSNINPVLRLSYHNLPSNLKRCFAYCSIFPRGFMFSKDQLIKLWVAEGLLKCSGTGKSEEELGNEFFKDLESISFFQLEKGWELFIMHDLVNDLAKSVSGEFCLRMEGDMVQGIVERTRHIWCSLKSKDDGDKILEHIYKSNGLRSLMVRARGHGAQRFEICNNVQHDLFSRLKCLRMLSFCGCNISELAKEISNLKLLRYLDLSWTQITSLPDSICMLHNLQTLMLNHSPFTGIPSDFYKLVNLRHLHVEGTLIKKMPKLIGRLNHLQTLTNFVVGEHSGSNIKELRKLNHLHGKLRIEGLRNVIDPADAAEANLKDKKHLEDLDIVFGGKREIDGSIIETQLFVLEALQPNTNLNNLFIEGYQGSNFPNWLRDCHLPNLVSLRLFECKFCTRLPPFGKLLSLKMLSVESCDGIEIIGTEFYGNNSSNVSFRSLEILQFYNMPDLKEWLCLEGFTSLKELSIRRCPKLKGALPQHLASLQKLSIIDCPELKAPFPKVGNISELQLVRCENILLSELPSSLKSASIRETMVIESSSSDLSRCNSLRILSISDWHSSSLPFALDLFTNLYYLYLRDCPQLESFSGGGFPSSLSSLKITRCPKLTVSIEKWGLFKLNSLKVFSVSGDFENMESFPEESLLPPSINSLRLGNCSKLRIINYRGLLHLKSLKSLFIHDCPCLERLPEEGLPNSLSALKIYRCPLLKQLYQKEAGERWHKIHHIPSVDIL